jgi:hypothetical protein
MYVIMTGRANSDHVIGIVRLIYLPMFNVMDVSPQVTATRVRAFSTGLFDQMFLLAFRDLLTRSHDLV